MLAAGDGTSQAGGAAEPGGVRGWKGIVLAQGVPLSAAKKLQERA